VHTIASNAGVEGAVVVGKLLEQGNTDLGYDAAKGRIFSDIFVHDLSVQLILDMIADIS
jgi:chaperonin GroEL (HSP60 family)